MKKLTSAILFLVVGLSAIGYGMGFCNSDAASDDDNTKPKCCINTEEYPKDKEPGEGKCGRP